MGAALLKRWLFSTSAVLAAQGCASGPVADFVEGITGPLDGSRPTTGAMPITAGEEFELIDLVRLLDPEHRRDEVCKETNFAGSNGRREEIQCAFAAFYTYTDGCDSVANALGGTLHNEICDGRSFSGATAKEAAKNLSLIVRRNQVQDEILAVSENVCRGFKISLNDQITKTNFALGTLATTLAGMGAIFTPADTARALSGAAGIASGIRAEYNDAYLQSLTVQVVTKGIELKREQILDEINGKRYGPPYLEEMREFELLGDDAPQKVQVGDGSSPISISIVDSKLRAQIGSDKIEVDLKCNENNSECEPQSIDAAVTQVRDLQRLLAATRDSNKVVRYAARPYIPLSPYDKIDIKLEEEFKEELLEKRTERKKLQDKIAEKDREISALKAAGRAAAQRAQEADKKAKADLQAEIGKKNAEKKGKEDKVAANKDEISKLQKKLIKSPGDRSRLSDLNAENAKLAGEIAGLEAELADLRAQAGQGQGQGQGRRTTNDKANAGKKIENCKPADNKDEKICVALNAALEKLGEDCKGTPAEANAEKCEAYNKLNEEERLQCLPAGKLDDEKKALCRTAGLLGEVAASSDPAPQTPQASAEPQNGASAPAASSGEIAKLETEKKALEEEVNTLNRRIGTLEAMFAGELAKVDALVGVVPISQYTVEMAVTDAMRFHAACTIPSGLEKALESVDNEKQPGFDALRKGLDDMLSIQRKMNDLEKLRRTGASGDAEEGGEE